MVYRITVDEYDRMVALGVFDDSRVEPIKEIPVVVGGVECGRIAVSDLLP
jgi:hypothetical protein